MRPSASPARSNGSTAIGTTSSTTSRSAAPTTRSCAAASAAEFGPVEWIFRADYAKLNGDGATNIDFDRSSVSAAQLATSSAASLGAPDTDLDDRKMNQFVTADVDDKQWGVNSTLSWDVGGGSTVRLINTYRDWENEQLDGDVIFTPTPVISRTGIFDSKSQNHELQFISPAETVARRPPRPGRGPLLLPREVRPGRAAAHERAVLQHGIPVRSHRRSSPFGTAATPSSRPMAGEAERDRSRTSIRRSTAMPPMRRPTSISPTSSSRRSAGATARTRRKGPTTSVTNPFLRRHCPRAGSAHVSGRRRQPVHLSPRPQL